MASKGKMSRLEAGYRELNDSERPVKMVETAVQLERQTSRKESEKNANQALKRLRAKMYSRKRISFLSDHGRDSYLCDFAVDGQAGNLSAKT